MNTTKHRRSERSTRADFESRRRSRTGGLRCSWSGKRLRYSSNSVACQGSDGGGGCSSSGDAFLKSNVVRSLSHGAAFVVEESLIPLGFGNGGVTAIRENLVVESKAPCFRAEHCGRWDRRVGVCCRNIAPLSLQREVLLVLVLTKPSF